MKIRHIVVAGSTLVLTALSFWIVAEGAHNEPYVILLKYDAITQIGIAFILIAAWISLAVAVITQVSQKTLSAVWLALLAWCAIILFYLRLSPIGFLSDLVQFHGAQ